MSLKVAGMKWMKNGRRRAGWNNKAHHGKENEVSDRKQGKFENNLIQHLGAILLGLMVEDV